MQPADAEWRDRRLMVVMGALVDEAWSVMEPNLHGLADAEYFWEPVPEAWGVRLRSEVRSPDAWGKGNWVVEHCFDGSMSPAMSTIGWRLMHAYDCTNDFTSRAFGTGARDWNDIEVASSAADAVAMMTDAIEQLRELLARSNDDVLLGVGDVDDDRARWLLLDKCIIEAIHHTAEIGVLRAMYRAQ